MVEFFAYLFFFVTGCVIGFGAFVGYGAYQVNQLRKKKDDLIDEVKKRASQYEERTASIKERLAKASQLAHAQADLRAQAEMPSKNATHSRHKNGLIAEIQDLEQQKLDILKTILAEGFNPTITVVHDGGSREELSLSDYVASAQRSVDALAGPKKTPAPSTDPSLPKQVGKFFVYKGGKPDGTTH